MERINHFNKNRKNISAFYGLTKFSDVPFDVFLKKQLIPNLSNYQKKYKDNVLNLNETKSKQLTVPLKVDWRKQNAVSPVQNQGICGACWAFASVEIMESMNAIKTGKLTRFSVQEMIDCAKNNDGCKGGDIYLLLDWLMAENVTILAESEYPIMLTEGNCKKRFTSGIRINNFQCGK